MFEYTVYLSKYYDAATRAALIVHFDGLNEPQTAAMEKMVADGMAPPFVVIAAPAGRLEPTFPGGTTRRLRVENYDHIGPEFPSFLVEELIPEATRVEKLSITANPDLHMTSGASSGGTCAFNACWFRNDYFRRSYLSSPSFHGLGGADEFVSYVQRCEPRPIRAYVTFDELESLGFFGNNYEAGLATVRFMTVAGYDFQWQYFPGKRHTWGNNDYDTQTEVVRFVWKDWDRHAVSVPGRTKDIAAVVGASAPWQEVPRGTAFPSGVSATAAGGTYQARGTEIWFAPKAGQPRKVADGFHDISALTVSSDRWRLYVGDRRSRYLLGMTIDPDGSLRDRRRINVLHLGVGSALMGAKDMALDTQDHLYVATDAGVQVATPGTYVQVILPLPNDLPADRVAFEGQTLFVASENRLFKRLLKVTGHIATSPMSAPSTDFGLQFVTHPFLAGTNRQP